MVCQIGAELGSFRRRVGYCGLPTYPMLLPRSGWYWWLFQWFLGTCCKMYQTLVTAFRAVARKKIMTEAMSMVKFSS